MDRNRRSCVSDALRRNTSSTSDTSKPDIDTSDPGRTYRVQDPSTERQYSTMVSMDTVHNVRGEPASTAAASVESHRVHARSGELSQYDVQGPPGNFPRLAPGSSSTVQSTHVENAFGGGTFPPTVTTRPLSRDLRHRGLRLPRGVRVPPLKKPKPHVGGGKTSSILTNPLPMPVQTASAATPSPRTETRPLDMTDIMTLVPAVFDSREEQMYLYCQDDKLDLVRELFDRAGLDPNGGFMFDGHISSFLTGAAEHGCKRVVELLLELKASPMGSPYENVRNEWDSPLRCACQRGSVALAKVLIDAGADVNRISKDAMMIWHTPLHVAAAHGHAELVEFLVQQGASVGVSNGAYVGDSPLFLAAQENDDSAVLRVLLKYNADVDGAPGTRRPIVIASELGKLDVVKCLLDSKAELSEPDQSNASALYMASQNGHTDVVKLLLERNADPCSPADDDKPIAIAAQNGHYTTCELLLARRADPNAVDTEGYTPLHVSAKGGLLSIVELILYYGGDANIRDANGRRPSRLTKNPSIRTLLVSRERTDRGGEKTCDTSDIEAHQIDLLAQLNDMRATIGGLTKENHELVEENKRLRARTDDASRILRENAELSARLRQLEAETRRVAAPHDTRGSDVFEIL